jgi:uncharacterized membrane protein
MGDFAGILILLGLVVLAVPVLLVMALIKIGNAKLRIDALERDVQRLQTQVSEARTARSAQPTSAPQAESVARPQAAAAPPPSRSAAVEDAPAAAPITGRARFDLPDDVDSHVSPPPLPWERAVPVGATAAQVQDAAQPSGTSATQMPPPRPQAPRIERPPPAPPFDPFTPIINGIRSWFTEGNVPVKIGMLVLLAGVAALLKYASDQRWLVVPIELRLAGVAAAAIGGLMFAWKHRETRRSFALSLQGGAIGVLMLVTFAAFKLYGLIPAGAAFGITVALVAGVGVLAVLQDALALAVFGILAGFLAPIWLSTGSGNHVALFSYYAVLNLGIFGIAWHRAWRLLNLLGFVFTFAIGTLWGVLDYQLEKFASTEPFLLLFFALYLLIPIFYANRRSEDHDGTSHHLVDGTLVFGTPLVAFALQAGLLQGERMPLALSALGAAAIYALLAAFLRGRDRFASLVDTYAVLAVGFSTLSVPLALSARATASVFALEGAALVWLGVRQGHRLPQISGVLLQLAAALAYVAGVGGISSGFSSMDAVAAHMAIANPAFMGALLIALAGFATAWTYRRELDGGLVGLFTLWAFGWWTFAGLQEIGEFVPYTHRVDAMLVFIVFTGWIAAELRRLFVEMTMLGVIAAIALLLGAPFALAQVVDHAHPFGEWGPATWAVFAILGWRALACLRDTGTGVRFIAQGGWCWAWVTVLASTAHEFAQRAHLGEGWLAASIGVPVVAFAAILQLQPSRLAPPLSRGFDDYRRWLLGSALFATGLMWFVSLMLPGDSAPLPWVSVVNPLELLQLAVLALLANWAWGKHEAGGSSMGVPLFALTAFAWITFATLRATHHWGGAPWSPSMLDDYVVQTALTVVWSVLGVLGWIFGSRRGDRLLWGAGAVLMGVVLLKLVLIDRTHLGNLFGIVSFMAYGLLCTAVGYFAPAPPRRPSTSEVSA